LVKLAGVPVKLLKRLAAGADALVAAGRLLHIDNSDIQKYHAGVALSREIGHGSAGEKLFSPPSEPGERREAKGNLYRFQRARTSQDRVMAITAFSPGMKDHYNVDEQRNRYCPA